MERSPTARKTTTRACASCRDRKVKCDSNSPCKNCSRHKRTCVYPPSRRRKHLLDSPQFSWQIQHTVNFPVEANISRETQENPQSTHSTTTASEISAPNQLPLLAPVIPQQPHQSESQAHEIDDSQEFPGHPRQAPGLTSHAKTQSPTSRSMTASGPTQRQDETNENGSLEPAGAAPGAVDENLIPPQWVNWEHHGPWSWVSVCSQSGLAWVCRTSGNEDFIEIASELTKTWSRRLKTTRSQSFAARCAEPDEGTAWKYVEAYFELSYDAVFGVVHRRSFEKRLRAHFATSEDFGAEDASWYALRNIIYAAGCRSLLAHDQSFDFITAESKARSFFQNALSVFTECIFGHSGLTAVQALTVMTFYAEGLGNPALEYPLCTNAVHLAQAKGLHRGHSASWGLSEAEILTRSWLWWAIYCLEKQIVFRGGRPSSIDDENISTPLPTKAPPGSTIDVEVFTLIVKHAQISSQITRRIMSVHAFQQTLSQATSTVRDITQNLEKLLQSVPPTLTVGSLSQEEQALSPRQTHAIYLHFAIYGSIMATNTIFLYPWLWGRFSSVEDPTLQQQIVQSSKAVAAAARQIIIVLKSLSITVAVPAWLAFYYPMYAYINMFVYILKYPLAHTVNGDLAMLDMVVGHFGHIEHVTLSEVSFQFPRESAALCVKTVKTVRGKEQICATVPGTPQVEADSTECAPSSSNAHGVDLPNALGNGLDGANFDACLLAAHSTDGAQVSGDHLGMMGLDMEGWNIFSSIDVFNSFPPMFD